MSAHWTDSTVREALTLAPADDAADVAYTGVSTDTRTLQPGELFVALRGAHFDAHTLLGQAAERGARGAVVERVPTDAPASLRYYRVPRTLVALGELARDYRRRLGARVCAITGTNGKTTTKELAHAVLATRWRAHSTTGNLNNLVGTPLTLLAAPADTETMVVEVATNAPGEIARLAAIVEPDAAIVTGVAEGHLEGLGSIEGVLEEKTSLLAALGDEGLAIVAEEPPALAERARTLARHVRVAGWTERATPELRTEDVALNGDGRVSFRWAGRDVQLKFRGRPNARNALLALGLGCAWGVDPDAAAAALATVEPLAMRAAVLRYGELRVVADCYNANPASLRAAVDLLVSLPRGGGRVAVLGTMKELGAESERLHRDAAEAMVRADVDLIVATGEFAHAFEPLARQLGDRLIRVEDPLEAYEPLARRLEGREVVLLKGSRGVALERLLPRLETEWSERRVGPDRGRTTRGG